MTGMRSLFVLAVLSTHAARAADTDALRGADTRPPVLVADADSPDTTDKSLRQRAEDLARAASQRFSEILSTDKPAPQPGDDNPPAESKSETFAPVWNWLARASKDYQDVVIGKLKSPDGWVVVVQRTDATTPMPSSGQQAEPQPEPRRGWSGLVEILRDWLARANRSYRNEIVKELVEPSEQEPAKATAEEPSRAAPPPAPAPSIAPAPGAPAPPVVTEAPQAKPDAGQAKRKADAEAQIKREAEAADAKRKADAQVRAQREMAATEARRKADIEAEARREAAAAAEAKRKFDVEAEAKRKSEAEAEAKRKAEDAKRLAEEGDAERKAVAEAEATRLATEAEEKRKVEREAKVRRAVQAAAKAAAANAVPPAAKELEKSENSGIAPGRNAATSERAPADSAPEKSAAAPSAPPMPARTASPDSSKLPETVAEKPVPPKAESKKRHLARAHTGRKRAYVRRHKPVYAKYRKHGYGHVYSYRKHRAVPVETTYRGPRCKWQCRCAGVHGYGYRHLRVTKPRKRLVWGRHAAPRFYASEAYVARPYRVHHRKARRSSLTYRHHRLYIHSHTY